MSEPLSHLSEQDAEALVDGYFRTLGTLVPPVGHPARAAARRSLQRQIDSLERDLSGRPTTPEHWINISAVGDRWEVEFNTTAEPNSRNAYRYRSAMFGNLKTEWSPGTPPTGAHALPAS